MIVADLQYYKNLTIVIDPSSGVNYASRVTPQFGAFFGDDEARNIDINALN